jgi:ankyrin repeat protein
LLENGADIHTENDYPLRIAASGGHFKAVRFLLANGADIHANNDDALRLAVRGGHTETVRLLLANGANARVNNDAALLKAIEGKQTEIIHLLAAHGAPLEMLPSEQRQAYDLYDRQQADLKKNLSNIFKAATWAGHVPEMLELWQQLPEILQANLDLPHLLAAATQQTMKQRSKKVSFTK